MHLIIRIHWKVWVKKGIILFLLYKIGGVNIFICSVFIPIFWNNNMIGHQYVLNSHLDTKGAYVLNSASDINIWHSCVIKHSKGKLDIDYILAPIIMSISFVRMQKFGFYFIM